MAKRSRGWSWFFIALGIGSLVLAIAAYVSGKYTCASVRSGPVCGVYLLFTQIFGQATGLVAAIAGMTLVGGCFLWAGIRGFIRNRSL